MKSLSKLLGALLLGLLLLIAVAGFALTYLLDPNDYKDEIRSLVQAKTGYDLQINGDIGWSLFPWLGLELADARLARVGMSDQPFADIRLLALSVQVLPLLRKEIRMSDIRLEGLDLTLHRNAKGDSNWEDAPADTGSAVTTAAETDNTQQPTAKPANIKLEIDSLIVNSARLDYSDEQNNQHITLESVQISTGAIGEQQNIPLKLSGFLASSTPLLRARMELSASAWMDNQSRQYRLDALKVAGEVAGEPLNNKSANIAANGNLQLDLKQQRLSWEQLRFSVNQLKGMGELQVEQLNDSPAIAGQLSLAAFNLREFLPGIGITLPAMQSKSALGHFELTAQLQGTRNSLLLDNASIRMDDSSFTGKLGIRNLEQGALLAHLTADQLNMDSYLPPTAPVKKPAKSAATSPPSSDLPPAIPSDNPWDDSELLPLNELAALNLELHLAFDRLTLEKLPFENVKLKLDAHNGKLDLKQFEARLYGGSIASSGTLDSNAEPARISMHNTIDQLPVDRLLSALGEEAPITGKLKLDSQLSTSGNSQRQWVSQLSGKANLEILDGTLPDSNLEQQLCLAIATLNRKPLSQDYSRTSTPFTQLKTSTSLSNGVATTPDVQIAIPGLLIKGKGTLDLNHMGMDQRLDIILQGDTRPMPDPACSVNKRYVGIEWPVHCRGSLATAGQNCRIDQDGLTRIATRLAGDKLTEKIEEKLKDKVSPDLKDALKGLFRK